MGQAKYLILSAITQNNIPTENVDMKNLTPEQKQDGEDMKANYGANPKMATDDANEIMHDYF